MSDTAASCRQRAAECEHKAALTSDKARRGIFHGLAKAWRDMAAEYEKLSGVVPDLIVKPARVACPDMSSDRDDYAVLYDGRIVGRIMKASLSGNEQRWDWSFERQSGKGYEMSKAANRNEAMAAFRRAWDAHQSAGD